MNKPISTHPCTHSDKPEANDQNRQFIQSQKTNGKKTFFYFETFFSALS